MADTIKVNYLVHVKEESSPSCTDRTDGYKVFTLTFFRDKQFTSDEEFARIGSFNYNEKYDLHDLRIRAQGTNSDRPRRLYGWTIAYDRSGIDLAAIERMALTLKTIDRALTKEAAAHGQPATFGQYVMRICRAIGADRVMFDFAPDVFYRTGRRYDVRDLVDGCDYLGYLERRWEQEPFDAEKESAAQAS